MSHTPLCSKDCNIKHHDVVTSLQAVAPRFNSSGSNDSFPGPVRATRGNNKEDFKKHVQKLVSEGWSKDKEVPEPFQLLKLPLLHLASMFGKHEVVEWLLNEEGYDAKLQTSISGETALHLVARHLYTALSPSGSRLENMSITAKVANFERVVSLLIEKEVSLFWAKDEVNRETPFHILAKQLLQASSGFVDGELEKEDLCLSFFSNSLDVTLKLMLAEEKTRLNRRDVKHALSIKNSEGNTALHYLAQAFRHGFLVLRFLVKSLGNNDLLKIKNSSGLSAIDIVNQVYPGHEKDLLIDEEVKKRAYKVVSKSYQNTAGKQMNLLEVLHTSGPNVTSSNSAAKSVVGVETATANSSVNRCAIHTELFPEGGCPVQDLVSSPSSLPSAMEVRNTNILQYQPVPPQVIPVESPPLTGVVHNPMSPTRPQAQVQSIQFSGQPALTGPNRLSVQATGRGVGQQMLPLVPQSFRVTPVEIVNAHQTPVPTHSTGSGSLQNTQSVDSTSQNLRGSIGDASRDHFLLQSMDRNRIENSTIEESLQLNADTSTSYTIDKWHTPMCNSKCIIEHHHLVLTLCGHSNRTNYRKNRFHQSQYTRSNFAHCIRKNLIEGFNKNADVLDGLEKLQLPLVHLAGIFFKYCAIETLSYFGFDLNVLSQKTGDFPLHSVLRHNYEGMKVYKGTTFMNTTYGEKVFTKVFNSLTNGLNAVEVLSQQDRNGDTPFLVAAKCVIDTSVHDTMQQVITASEIPDSTQECSGSNSQMGKSLNNSSGVCNAMKANKQQHRADFHMGCIGVMIQKLHESSIVNHKVDLTLAKKVLMVKNNCGETFLQVLCKEHHIAGACISKVLSKFPLGILIECAKECIPESCWPDCVRSERRSVKQREIANLAYTSGTVNSALETTPTSKRKGDAQPSKPESPRWSSDARMTQPSPTTSTVDSAMDSAPWSYSTPLSATPLHKEELGSVSPLDAMLSPVLANPSQATLRPNTKRKIIDALKEDYSERLELAVKGRNEVEEDILKHKKKTRELTEIMSKKREVMRKMERELQELQKEIWHENQAVQALENSLEQFTKEEDEMQKNLAVLQGVDPEPAAKQSKSSDQESTL